MEMNKKVKVGKIEREEKYGEDKKDKHFVWFCLVNCWQATKGCRARSVAHIFEMNPNNVFFFFKIFDAKNSHFQIDRKCRRSSCCRSLSLVAKMSLKLNSRERPKSTGCLGEEENHIKLGLSQIQKKI